MEMTLLPAELRTSGEKAKAVRQRSRIPAVYYGHGKKNLSLSLDYQTFRKTFDKAGESTVVELSIDGQKVPVLIYDVQYNPVTDRISHVDFYHVDMEKEVTTKVPVKLVGMAPAVKNLGGILTTHKHEITIRCLPKYLIHSVEVDVSSLEDFHSSIHVKSLKVSPEVKILDDPEDAIANVRPVRVEEEAPKPEAVAVEGAPVEGVVAPGAEGAAAAPAAGAGAKPAAGGAPGAAPAGSAKPAKEEKKK